MLFPHRRFLGACSGLAPLISGWAVLMGRPAVSMPPSLGIDMSSNHQLGKSVHSFQKIKAFLAVAGLAHDLDFAFHDENAFQILAKHGMIIGNHNAVRLLSGHLLL